jgi:hypothetical protein
MRTIHTAHATCKVQFRFWHFLPSGFDFRMFVTRSAESEYVCPSVCPPIRMFPSQFTKLVSTKFSLDHCALHLCNPISLLVITFVHNLIYDAIPCSTAYLLSIRFIDSTFVATKIEHQGQGRMKYCNTAKNFIYKLRAHQTGVHLSAFHYNSCNAI